jgi:hypothetical protein
VAKTRRFGLSERVGWLRKGDVDSEMWPEESFGGVSDEQFWDDLSADKPLANTARTAQPEGESRPRPARPGRSRLAPLPGGNPGAAPAHGQQPAQGQAATQAFPVGGQHASGSRTGPQVAFTGSHAPYSGPPSAHTGPQAAVHTGPQPAVPTGPQPMYTGPLPTRPAASRPGSQPPAYHQSQPQPYQSQPLAQHIPPAQAMPPAQSLPPTQGLPTLMALPSGGSSAASAAAASGGGQPVPRGRHSSRPSGAGDDPLTSDKFSLRSAPDGRSYQAARRSRNMTREQYEAAIAQETQTFSMSDDNGYPAQTGGDPRRRYGDARPSESGPYGRDGQPYPYPQQPENQASSYDDDFDSRDYGTRNEPRRANPARDASGRHGYGRPARPVYPDARGPYDPRGGDRR